MGCHFLLQGIFLIQGSNLHLKLSGFLTTEPPGNPENICNRNLRKEMWTEDITKGVIKKVISGRKPQTFINNKRNRKGENRTHSERSSVQLFGRVRLCNPMNHSTPGLPVHHQLPESTQTMSIESMMPSDHLILIHPLLLLPSIFPSIRVFSDESTLCIRWSKYWSFSFNISPSNEHPGLISFRMDWLDLLEVQGTLKSLLQQHSSKASILGAQLFL